MKVIKYIIELRMIYSLDDNYLDTIAEFDNIIDAIKELEIIARIYANHKNVAIEVVKYAFDKVVFEYEFLDKVIGLYGVDAAKVKNITSKNKKFGLIIA